MKLSYKKIICFNLLISFGIATILAVPIFSFAIDVPINTTAKVYFSPNGGCAEAIIEGIDRAKSEIIVQAYSFTSAPIAKALLNAHKRGIKIVTVLDKSNKTAKYSSATFFYNSGIPVFIDSAHTIAHNKIIILDRETVITGSFNFSKAAEEKNAENVLILKSKDLAKVYFNNWQDHKEHSAEYGKRNLLF